MSRRPPAPRRNPRARWAVLGLALLLVFVACAACGGKPPRPPGTSDDAAVKKVPTVVQSVVGHLLGSIADRTIGPFLARVPGQGSIVAWVTPAEGNARHIIAIPLTAVGEPRGAPKTIANVGVDTTMLVVRPTRGATPGVALAWTVLTDRGEALWSIVLGEDGTPRGKAVELARTGDDVVWVDAVATDHGAVVVWAEETRGGDANVVVASLDADGKIRGVPARIARGVSGWHAFELPGGVGISTVTTVKGAKGGTLSFQRLDAEGHPGAPPVAVVTTPVVSGDVEVVRAAGRLVFAWTDRTTDDPAIVAAALGDDGKLESPHRVVEARGGAALLGLASGPAGTAMMWEAPVRRTNDTRRLYSARISPALGIEGRPSSLEIVGRASPELVATTAGFAILAPIRDCEPASPRCNDAPIVPTVLRTDEHLVPVQREPLGFITDPASLAWGMTCDRDVCLALAASGTSPARVRAAEVRSRVNMKALPDPASVPVREGPRVTDVSAIATNENVIDIAATRIGDKTLLATIATKAEAAGGTKVHGAGDDARNAPLVLSTRLIDAAGVVSPPVIITTRALAVGGVAIAPAGTSADGAAVAWVGRDNGDPEVHVTKIDKNGKKGNDLQLTTTKGDASDVAIAWAGGGWVVAWVDGRDGNGEVYATRVSFDLTRGNGERLTNAPGDASDLVALALGDRVWLAWADPRESPKDGMADVFVTAVNTKDARRAVDEQRLLATAAHSRTPQLAPAADGVHVAWIEESPLGVESPASSGYGAMWATVANGKVQKPVKLPLGGDGAATSVALESHAGGLRAVIARSMTDAIALDAVELTVADPQAIPLLTLDGPPSLDVALVLETGMLYFNDDGPAPADKRARRARIAWKP